MKSMLNRVLCQRCHTKPLCQCHVYEYSVTLSPTAPVGVTNSQTDRLYRGNTVIILFCYVYTVNVPNMYTVTNCTLYNAAYPTKYTLLPILSLILLLLITKYTLKVQCLYLEYRYAVTNCTTVSVYTLSKYTVSK